MTSFHLVRFNAALLGKGFSEFRYLGLRVNPISRRWNSTAIEGDQKAPIASDLIAPTLKVDDSKLHPNVKSSFKKIGDTFTEVQKECLNKFSDSNDGIVVRAKTGTGKTFGFGLPIIENMVSQFSEKDLNGRSKRPPNNTLVNSVIFSPTRDLATQTFNALRKLWNGAVSFNTSTDLLLVMGQTARRENLRPFKARRNVPRIVIATPGRFADLFESEESFRSGFKHLNNIVIDEADELLNSNFREATIDLIKALKENRQVPPEDSKDQRNLKTMMFSATINDDVIHLAKHAVGPDFPFIDIVDNGCEVNENITQELIHSGSIFQSYAAALQFINDNDKVIPNFKAIVFDSTVVGVDFAHSLAGHVLERGLPKYVLHGKLTQGKRNSQERLFRNAKRGVLFASNVAARGMDFPNVTHVIQIGISNEIESYTHRIGRTARAGKKGKALLIATDPEMCYVDAIEKLGNNFTLNSKYEPDPEFLTKVNEAAEELDAGQLTFSKLAFYSSIPKSLKNYNIENFAKDCSKFFTDLSGDEGRQPHMSADRARRMGLDTRMISRYFDLGRSGFGGFRNSGRNERNNYGRNNYGKSNYGRNNYGRDSDGRNNYGRNNYGRNNYGRNNYGRNNYGRDNSYDKDGERSEYGKRDGFRYGSRSGRSDGYNRDQRYNRDGQENGYRNRSSRDNEKEQEDFF